jgi:cytochrome c oxidase subunit II
MIRRLYRSGLCLLAVLLLSGCAAEPISPPNMPSTLEPRGPNAAHLAQLWWVMLGLGTAIFVLVTALLAAALLRRQRATSATAPETSSNVGRRWLIQGGIILPLIVLAIVFGYTIYTLAAVEVPPGQPAVQIHVIARQWWWQVDYPDQGITTANEIHVPVGVPVQIRLESADVIHSFWVPQLAGKMDLIPTRINTVTLQSDEAGVYRGQCAEFCGLQHAHMGFMVVAQNESDFNAWLAAQQQTATAPTDPTAQQGQRVFVSAGCVFCHTVHGLDDKRIDRSAIDLGPDLTHLSSRLTIAGASLSQNRGNVAGWIVDPQHVKPGARMPNQYLNSEDLQALLAYLTTLQ